MKFLREVMFNFTGKDNRISVLLHEDIGKNGTGYLETSALNLSRSCFCSYLKGISFEIPDLFTKARPSIRTNASFFL
jgi:hypothetical protein